MARKGVMAPERALAGKERRVTRAAEQATPSHRQQSGADQLSGGEEETPP